MLYLIDFENGNVLHVVLWFHIACVCVGLVVGSLQLLAWRRLAASPQPLGSLAVDQWAFVWTQPVLLIDIPWDERRDPPRARHIFTNFANYVMPVFCQVCLCGALLGALADAFKIARKALRRLIGSADPDAGA